MNDEVETVDSVSENEIDENQKILSAYLDTSSDEVDNFCEGIHTDLLKATKCVPRSFEFMPLFRHLLTHLDKSVEVIKILQYQIKLLKDYVDEEDNILHDYIDTQIAKLRSYVDTQITETKSYADSVGSATLGSAKSYTDNETASALSEAKSYADSVANSALSEAKAYADSLFNSID